MRFFPYTIAVLDIGAAIVYCLNGQWRLALMWSCYAVATIAVAGIR